MLSKEELRAQRQKALESVTSVLGITDDEAARLLRKYKWWVAESRPFCILAPVSE